MRDSYKNNRIGVEFQTDEEKQLYIDLKEASRARGMKIRQGTLFVLRKGLAILQRKPLPPQK